MAITPAINQSLEFQPAVKRVQQSNDFDDAFACIAMVTGKTLEEVRQTAIDKFKHPKHGPYWISESLMTGLLAHYGWVATVYKEGTGIASLPDIAIGLVEYDEKTEIGRHVFFHRTNVGENPKRVVEYIIDPAYWVDVSKHVRTDIKGFPISWFIGLHPMAKPQVKGSK